MAVAVPTLRVDWANNGGFTDSIDTVHPLDEPAMSFSRGRSGDFTSDAAGQLVFTLDNTDDAYSFDRNWHDNPSFETDTSGYAVAAVASVTAAGTSITKVVDNAPNAGTAAGEAVLTATLNSGVTYAYPVNYRFKSGVAYSATVMLKSASGSLTVQAGLASIGTPADIATSAAGITAAWVKYAFTWTPSADRTDATFFVRTTTAAAATVRIDAVQVNPSATVNPYLEAPTKGQLVPGRPVHLFATYSAVQYPLFFGYLERITPDPQNRTVTFTAYDVLRKLAETDVVVAANPYISRSARDMRIEALGDYERGTRNLIGNPEFATNTTGWAAQGGTITRVTNDAPPGAGTTSGDLAWTSGTATLDHVIRLAPVFYAGQVFRFAVYLKVTAGTLPVTIGIGEDSGVLTFVSRSVTATTTWTRYTITYATPTTRSANSLQALRPFLTTTSGTVRLGGAMFTRGQALYPYASVTTGRWPNWCGNGSFDGGALNGWYDGFSNMVANPSFEVDTTGWSSAADAFHTLAGAITRVTTAPFVGTAHGSFGATAALQGTHYTITGTFKLGVTYDVRGHARTASTTMNAHIGIGSNGTPADKAESGNIGLNGTTYTLMTTAWTPTADRTDAHLYVLDNTGGNTLYIDGFTVFRRDAAAAAGPTSYSDTGPGVIGSFVTTRALSTTAKYGSTSQSIATPATIGAGRVYDFKHYGSYFASGQPFTVSVWLNPTSNMPYKVGIGANNGDGTWDEPTAATGTATANVWTQVTVTWAPSAAHTTSTAFDVVLYIYQTDATARTILIDGIRVIPASTADNVEQTYWNVPASAESDIIATTAGLNSSALAALQSINTAVLSRHWITATLATPFWQYNVQDRATYAAAVSAEAFTDGVTTALQAITPPELDRQSISNVVAITAATTEYYSDDTSVGAYGSRPATSIGGANFYADLVLPALVGAAYLARYAQPIRRPSFTVTNRFPSQLQRDVNDMVTLTVAAWLVIALFGNIARLTTTVSATGQNWTTVYQVEEKL